jgi:hypothetical protein
MVLDTTRLDVKIIIAMGRLAQESSPKSYPDEKLTPDFAERVCE